MKLKHKTLVLAVSTFFASGCATADKPVVDAKLKAQIDKIIVESFPAGENQDLSRLKQDETIQACNQYRDNVPDKVAAAIIERETKNIKYPADGKLMGDWKTGEKYYKMGFAYRIGTVDPDKPDKDRGGNCYACHSADPKELAYGTIGSSLTGWSKLRGNSDDIVKYTYEKIYNAQAFNACSQMPRLGHNGILTPEKIAHITAFLMSPDSPVNK